MRKGDFFFRPTARFHFLKISTSLKIVLLQRAHILPMSFSLVSIATTSPTSYHSLWYLFFEDINLELIRLFCNKSFSEVILLYFFTLTLFTIYMCVCISSLAARVSEPEYYTRNVWKNCMAFTCIYLRASLKLALGATLLLERKILC